MKPSLTCHLPPSRSISLPSHLSLPQAPGSLPPSLPPRCWRTHPFSRMECRWWLERRRGSPLESTATASSSSKEGTTKASRSTRGLARPPPPAPPPVPPSPPPFPIPTPKFPARKQKRLSFLYHCCSLRVWGRLLANGETFYKHGQETVRETV